jgi:hypothetical protein
MIVLPTILAALHAVKGLSIGVAASFLGADEDYLLATLAVTEELYLWELKVFV